MTTERGAAGRPLRVLLVEDDPATAFVVRVNLELDGMEVAVARDGADGLALAQTLPDAILLDLRLEGMDGWCALARLGADPATSGIPVVILSGEPDVELRALDAGAAAFVPKPFDPLAIAPVVHAVCRPAREAASTIAGECRRSRPIVGRRIAAAATTAPSASSS
jgi:DNA-binding response OmpR family regulator